MTSLPSTRTPILDAGPATRLLVFCCLGLVATPLRADVLFGGQVAVAEPQGDLNGGHWLHGNTGIGIGLHALLSPDGTSGIRLRGDTSFYPRGPIVVEADNGSYPLFNESAKAAILDLALDYNWFFRQNLEGPYGIAGLGYSRARFYGVSLSPEDIGVYTGPLPSAHQSSAILYAVGLGWRISEHLGWEARFSESTMHDVGGPGTFTRIPIFTAAVTFEF